MMYALCISGGAVFGYILCALFSREDQVSERRKRLHAEYEAKKYKDEYQMLVTEMVKKSRGVHRTETKP